MALNPTSLEDGLRDTVFPTTSIVPSVVAGQWQGVLGSYAAAIVPASTTVVAAGAAMATTLAGIFSTGGSPSSKAAAMEAAFLAWATAVGIGMVAAGFGSTPPAGSLGFAAEFGKDPGDWQTTWPAAATFWAGKIDTWMKTGHATLIAPPNTVIPWS